MLKNAVSITFETTLDEQVMDAKQTLAELALAESPVDLTVTAQQMRLPFKAPATKDDEMPI